MSFQSEFVTYEPDEMGFGNEDGTVWLPRSIYPTRNDARKWFAEFSGVPWVEVRVLSRWGVHDPQPYERDWWAVCPRGTPGSFRVWECS